MQHSHFYRTDRSKNSKNKFLKEIAGAHPVYALVVLLKVEKGEESSPRDRQLRSPKSSEVINIITWLLFFSPKVFTVVIGRSCGDSPGYGN